MDNSNIDALHLEIGIGSVIEPTAIIRGMHGPAKRVSIGSHCYIGTNVQIICDDFELGDYCKIHHDTNIHGAQPCRIGHNAWIGQFCIIDSQGGVTLGNNCGVGASSQLWSHIKYGDTLEGNLFNSTKALNVGNDVWFVGHCIVSPIEAADKSMAMAGSVVTRNMAFNSIYAGVPARSISKKIGPQFREISTAEKLRMMRVYLREFDPNVSDIRIVENLDEIQEDGMSYFVVSERRYLKTGSVNEVRFMKFLLPEKAKFIPIK